MTKWIPAGLGAEPKKVIILAVLVVLLPLAYWYGNSSDTPAGAASSAPKTTPVPAAESSITPSIARTSPRTTTRVARGGTDDFRPSLKLPDNFDLTKVDPTLRTDLLARVRAVSEAGGTRSLFEFYTPPPPPPPVAPIKPQPPKPPVIAETKPAPPPTPVKQGPPPIPLKYFGYQGLPRAGGRLQAFFVDGEDQFIAGENEMIRNRYRVVRIGVTSAEVEDTVAKNTQTLRLLEKQDP